MNEQPEPGADDRIPDQCQIDPVELTALVTSSDAAHRSALKTAGEVRQQSLIDFLR
jgi:hypothetical protein